MAKLAAAGPGIHLHSPVTCSISAIYGISEMPEHYGYCKNIMATVSLFPSMRK